MSNKIELKDRMEYSDMVALHQEYYPWLTPNRVNVGMLAKRVGYVKRHQLINNRMVTFYLKKSIADGTKI